MVEVVLAIGVVAVSFLSVFGLLVAGMQDFNRAVDTSVSSEIVQRIASDAEQTDFNTLIGNSVSGNYYALPMRYFDDQGSEVSVVDPTAPSKKELARILYWVRVRGSLPGSPDPANHNTAWFTSLPTTGSQRFNPRASTYLTVQITSNPAGTDLKSLLDAAYLIDETRARAARLQLHTYPSVIARNGY